MSDENNSNELSLKGKATTQKEISHSQVSEPAVESDNEDEQENAAVGSTTTSTAISKKKKSKKKRIKAALGVGPNGGPSSSSKDEISKALGGLNKDQIAELMKMNPALAQTVGDQLGGSKDLTGKDAADVMKKLSLEDILTGLAQSGKNVKDMASYKFWQTQPVPKFGETGPIVEGPFKIINPEQVSKEPGPLVDGFEWVTMDLLDDEQVQEVFTLLYGHYVEDDGAMFRFNYSKSFLRW